MPHIVLEYTDNVVDTVHTVRLFNDLHQALVALGDVELNEIKSRAYRLTDWFVGDGDSKHAFAHLKLYLIDRRTPEFKRRALAVIKPIIAAHFEQSLLLLNCQLCFEIIDIRGDAYEKIVTQDHSHV